MPLILLVDHLTVTPNICVAITAVLTKDKGPVTAEYHVTVYASLGNHRCRIYSAWCSHSCWNLHPLSTGNEDSWWQDVENCHFTSWVKGETQYKMWLADWTMHVFPCLVFVNMHVWVAVWYLLLHSNFVRFELTYMFFSLFVDYLTFLSVAQTLLYSFVLRLVRKGGVPVPVAARSKA